MANATAIRTWRGQMGWRISGQARIDRWVRAESRSLHLTLSGALLSLVMLLQGLVLLPQFPGQVSAPFSDILVRAFPVEWWGGFAILVGGTQLVGYTLAWLGLVRPHRALRRLTASCVLGYFSAICVALLLGGYSFGPPTYLMLVILGIRDLTEAGQSA